MLRRDIIDELKKWKDDSKRKCLVIRGARQVGKTYAVQRFGEEEYESFVEINFLENPSMKKIFSGDLDSKTIRTNISLYIPESRVIPGKTCLFLDEIQECPEAITSLKFLAKDKDFDVIASGSMLGIDYKRPTSYPVGSIQYIDMYALSFKEFLYAAGVTDEIIDSLRSYFENEIMVPWAIHDRIMELFRLYIIIGGMPEAVSLYFEKSSISDADKKVREILDDYRYDIAHYAKADVKIKAEECYFSIFRQLSKENHKFMYSNVEKGGTARKYGSSIDWLKGAYLVLCVYNTSGYDIPLNARRIDDNFRVYPTDIGILMGMFDYSVKEQIIHPENKLLGGMSKGGIYEAVVADMLIKNGHRELFFRKNETSTFEIEFLIEKSEGVIPIEVKAGNSRSKSLDNLLKRDEIPYGYKLIDGNVGISGKKKTMPLYMAMFI
ncbi:MAG: ATP-binding protein [Eubacterium sp.]|nr:ATP-binding protein [Eubacterium sp.]